MNLFAHLFVFNKSIIMKKMAIEYVSGITIWLILCFINSVRKRNANSSRLVRSRPNPNSDSSLLIGIYRIGDMRIDVISIDVLLKQLILISIEKSVRQL